ncbi:MAG: LacI family transcriptional regulator [Anaerolineae bacterium]|nr:LacI family transcriptional regulator [Anaerolineae bacterium]MDW8172683.1 LacI family DNA-binding transcriptional regulator [Anaerolineae bacterium]
MSRPFADEPSFSSGSVTIHDVAQAAGVSVSTVSRILNGKPDVAKATRQRVQNVIERLGYTPHVSAQSLAARRSNQISLLFPLEHANLTQLELDFFVSAAEAAEAADYILNLITTPLDTTRLLNLYKSKQTDGVILMQVQMDDARAQILRAQGYPFVMIGHGQDSDGMSFVDMDFEATFALALQHLVDLGHRQVGFIARPYTMRQRNLGSAVRTLKGYLDACERLSLTPHYREPLLDPQEVYVAARELLREEPSMTAIIASNGAASVAVMRAVQETGRSVPADFSLVALATAKIANLTTPPLTAIHFPTDKMGYEAARILTSMLRDPARPLEQILIAPELIVRGTTQSPR